MRTLLPLALLTPLLAGCGSDAQLLEATLRVIVSTDAPIGDGANGEINKLEIVVLRGGSTAFDGKYSLTSPAGEGETLVTLPDSLLLHNGHRFDDTGNLISTPIEITATARNGTTNVITRCATDMVFDNDKPVVLHLPLCMQCAVPDPLAQDCPTDETCVAGSCQSARIDLSLLPEDDGTAPPESSECPTPQG
jgi:hypothetical protein